MEVNVKQLNYYCVKCGNKFRSYGQMIAHSTQCMMKFNRRDSNCRELILDTRVLAVYSCDECGERFYYRHLLAHRISCAKEQDSGEDHDELDSESSDVCFSKNLRNDIYSRICRSMSRNKKCESRVRQPCDKVGNTLLAGDDRSIQNMKSRTEKDSEQIKSKSIEKVFKYADYDKKFSPRVYLERHNLIHTKFVIGMEKKKTLQDGEHIKKNSNMPLRCQMCNKYFSVEWSLDRHMRAHMKCHNSAVMKEKHMMEKFDCSKVKTTANVKENQEDDNLNIEEACSRLHSKAKPYCCKYCEKCCVTSTDLKAHIRIHTGEKPFKCDVCGKAFRRKHHLNDHMNSIHLKLRPYCCNVCQKSFYRRRVLNSHMMKVHPEKTVLNVHVKRHRNGENSRFLRAFDGGTKGRLKRRNPQV